MSAPAGGGDSFLVVGSSNASRLAEALVDKGISTGSVICKSWRANKQSVADLATHVKNELDRAKYTTLVFQVLDNNMFFARYEEGGLVPACKGLGGVYHVDGDLVVADREAQYAILKLCRPLWEAGGGKNFVIVGPMPRYVSGPCPGMCRPAAVRTRNISQPVDWQLLREAKNRPQDYQQYYQGLPVLIRAAQRGGDGPPAQHGRVGTERQMGL